MSTTHQQLDQLLLAFPGADRCFPFDNTTAVFKVMGKMFALISVDAKPLSINLKCAPEDALILRAQFKSIKPGYHMNKDHWNTIILDGQIDSGLLIKLVEDSYNLVVKKLPKKTREKLSALHPS